MSILKNYHVAYRSIGIKIIFCRPKQCYWNSNENIHSAKWAKKFVKYKRCHVNIGVNNLFYIVISSSSTKTKHHQQNDQKQKWQCSSCSFRDCDCVRECESWRWQKATWLINSLINWLTKLSEKTLEMIWTVWAPSFIQHLFNVFIFLSLSLTLVFSHFHSFVLFVFMFR